MTTAITTGGKRVHFPGSFATDAAGVIIPPTAEELTRIAEAIEPRELLVFATRLVRNTRKRRWQPPHAALNRSRLELARLCFDRALRDLV